MSPTSTLQAVCCFGLTCVWGCSQALPPGVTVKGSVKAENSPLSEGLITFIPLGGTVGHKCSVLIHDGTYIVDSTQGLIAGEYRVEVMGMPPGIKAMASGSNPSHSPTKSTYREIAPEFNRNSKLKCLLEAAVENQIDFSVRYVP